MSIFEPIIGGVVQGALGGLNNIYSAQREAEARAANYRYNEQAAQNADARTRALYNDIYSPSALMKQYQEAGLSPSLMFGGTPGQGGTAGAQGAGVNQPSTYAPISIIEGAQAALMAAQVENVKADTANKEEENYILRAEKSIKRNEELLKTWETEKYTTQYKIITSPIYTKEDDDKMGFTSLTLFGLAERAESFGQFVREFDEKYRFANDVDIHSEAAMQTFRNIYKMAHTMQTEIETLTVAKEKLEKEKDYTEEDIKLLEFNNKLNDALQSHGFLEMNAENAIKFLKSQIASAELTEKQKQAWNRLIASMGNSTMADIATIVLSILSSNISVGFKVGGK